jgi:hypothetical protein
MRRVYLEGTKQLLNDRMRPPFDHRHLACPSRVTQRRRTGVKALQQMQEFYEVIGLSVRSTE